MQSLLLRRVPAPAEGRLRAQPRGARGAPAQAARHILRRPGGCRHGDHHVPAELRVEALDGVHVPLRALLATYGDDNAALMAALDVEEVPYGGLLLDAESVNLARLERERGGATR